jgi:hypothetical protein
MYESSRKLDLTAKNSKGTSLLTAHHPCSKP